MLWQAYKAAFHSVEKWWYEDRLERQRAGIDRHVKAFGRWWTVEEKIRFNAPPFKGELPDDLLIEDISNTATGALGWTRKPVAADIVAYLWLNAGAAVLLPTTYFQSRVNERLDDWRAAYGHLPFSRTVGSRTYYTLNIAVPFPQFMLTGVKVITGLTNGEQQVMSRCYV